MADARHHDIVVIGASAGGVEALTSLVRDLPAGTASSLFVVLHIPAQAPSLLPEILARAGLLTATAARDGERIRRGHIYVCPPDHHLIVVDGHLRVTRGPKENGHRPAIDPLFRSAALSYGQRVMGVILSGTLDDGMLGSLEVKRNGGMTVAQDPNEALFDSMPRSVIESVGPTHVLPVKEIAALIGAENGGLAAGPGEEEMADYRQEDLTVEQEEVEYPESPVRQGTPSVYSCPDCGGTLWEMHDGDILHFRCRVGHGYASGSLLNAQTHALDGALWTALRALDEKIALSRRLRDLAADRGQELAKRRFNEDADEAERGAQVLRRLLRVGEDTVVPGASPAAEPRA
jgi:two-component system chemotaxis response regulator CheB